MSEDDEPELARDDLGSAPRPRLTCHDLSSLGATEEKRA